MVQMEKIITGAASGTIPVYWFGVCCSQWSYIYNT
jgi:hypothetical protein